MTQGEKGAEALDVSPASDDTSGEAQKGEQEAAMTAPATGEVASNEREGDHGADLSAGDGSPVSSEENSEEEGGNASAEGAGSPVLSDDEVQPEDQETSDIMVEPDAVPEGTDAGNRS